MPFYDYGCEKCSAEFETFHSIKESPKVRCPECNSLKTRKLVSACGIIVHNTGAKRRVCDHFRREADAKQDLLENHGVENVRPNRGHTFSSVYNDIKSRGTFVQDQMQQQAGEREQKQRRKRKEMAKRANKTATARAKVIKEKKAKKEAEKRAIRL